MDYLETRNHELRKRRLMMVDGNLTLNSQTVEGGASARVHRDGYWGFAATPASDATSMEHNKAQAKRNAQAMARFGPKAAQALPGGNYRGRHAFQGRPALSQSECVERMSALHAWCKQRFSDLRSTRFLLQDEHHSKAVTNSNGADAFRPARSRCCSTVFRRAH